ncbi:MAG TPA: hypothetical protein VIY08_14690 [Candidatus Nitrosocosmicus sp.]
MLLYLSNTILFENIKQVWVDSIKATIPVQTSPIAVAYNSNNRDLRS